MNPETREKLMGVSVATLCSALYKRGLRNQTIQDVRPVRAKGRNMVGPAFTLRYMLAGALDAFHPFCSSGRGHRRYRGRRHSHSWSSGCEKIS